MFARLVFVSCLILPVFCGVAGAGKLDDFEDTATSGKPRGSSGGSSRDDEIADDVFDGCLNECCNVFSSAAGALALGAGLNSLDRVRSGARQTGELSLPFARLDITYQAVESDVQATDYLVEVGYGPFGLLGRTTHYSEEHPDDTLDISQFYLLWRMFVDTETVNVGFNVGGGVYAIEGDASTNSAAYVLGVIIEPLPSLALEARHQGASMSGNYLSDTDLSVFATWRYVSLRAGYRFLGVGNETLNGPFVGLSLRY